MNRKISTLWNPRPYFLDFYRVFCYELYITFLQGYEKLSLGRTNNQKRAVRAGGTRMSLERLRSVFSGKIKAPLLAGALPFALLAAFTGQAHAGDAQASAQAAATEYSVPLKDMSDDRVRFVNRMAATVSKDAILVVYYGSDQDSIDAVRTGASMAKNVGLPVRGMILAKGDESYKVYVDGLPIGESVGELGISTPHWTRNTIVKSYQTMQDAQAAVDRDNPTISQN